MKTGMGNAWVPLIDGSRRPGASSRRGLLAPDLEFELLGFVGVGDGASLVVEPSVEVGRILVLAVLHEGDGGLHGEL